MIEDAAVADAEAVYAIYFHGPAYQVLESVWRDGDAVVGRLSHDLPTDREPSDATIVTPPRLVELCFQTAGVRELPGPRNELDDGREAGGIAQDAAESARAGGGEVHGQHRAIL